MQLQHSLRVRAAGLREREFIRDVKTEVCWVALDGDDAALAAVERVVLVRLWWGAGQGVEEREDVRELDVEGRHVGVQVRDVFAWRRCGLHRCRFWAVFGRGGLQFREVVLVSLYGEKPNVLIEIA